MPSPTSGRRKGGTRAVDACAAARVGAEGKEGRVAGAAEFFFPSAPPAGHQTCFTRSNADLDSMMFATPTRVGCGGGVGVFVARQRETPAQLRSPIGPSYARRPPRVACKPLAPIFADKKLSKPLPKKTTLMPALARLRACVAPPDRAGRATPPKHHVPPRSAARTAVRASAGGGEPGADPSAAPGRDGSASAAASGAFYFWTAVLLGSSTSPWGGQDGRAASSIPRPAAPNPSPAALRSP